MDSNRLLQPEPVHEQIRKRVAKGFERRNIEFVRETFDSHKGKDSEVISASSLAPALVDLGVLINATELDEILKVRSSGTRDLNDDGGLNFREFTSLVCTPSPIEEWITELPLSQIVADAMPVQNASADCLITDQLRHLSQATSKQLEESCDVIKEFLFKILQEKLSLLKEAYANLDSQTTANSNSKFQISKMSVGNIADFHEGLAQRIGFEALFFNSNV
jgi:hypothetical protein